jgi:hypothetical protein
LLTDQRANDKNLRKSNGQKTGIAQDKTIQRSKLMAHENIQSRWKLIAQGR